MKKFILALLLTVLFVLPARAGPLDDKPDPLLVAYMAKLPTVEERTETALAITRTMYPRWREMYQQGKFDCTEMSAYVVYFLNKCGIEGTIKYSPGLLHAWVEVPGSTKIIIEATDLRMLTPGREWWACYYYRFNDVITANLPDSEIDWWEAI